MKSEKGNESLDTIMSQAIGKQPLISFSRAGDSSAQLIQLLQALEQQEHNQGWPFLSSLKVQVQKCDKCYREYCSSINYRRHQRVHHRLKTLDKDAAKSRDWLGAFWDKLSLEEAKEVVSFKNVALEEVPGSSIIKALSALVRKSGFSSLPQLYLKAGSEILDIVQGTPSRFPVSSSELFTILDYASEKTFLCGPAISMQKYIFDGDAGKTGLETKNVVASSSFLLEQKLINAWRADRDAEALRFQKLLVEEEEAARKRRAEDLEKKRQKRLKQKEQKERIDGEEDVNETIENVSGEKANVKDPIENASVEKAVVKETIENASGEKTDGNDIDYTSGKKTYVNETVGANLAEKANVNKAFDEKAGVNETIDKAAEEMPSAETSSPVACDPQTNAADMPNVDQHLSTVERSNPDINLDFNSLTGFDGGQIDPGNSSPVDEGPFVQGRGRRWWRKLSRKSQLPASPGAHTTQSSQASKPAVSPSRSYIPKGSPASKPAISPSSSYVPKGYPAPKPAVSPSTYVVKSSPDSKPGISPSSNYVVKDSPASKPVVAPWSSYLAQGSQAPKPAVAPSSSYAAQGSQALKPAIAPSSIYAARGSQEPKPAIAPWSSYLAQGSQTPKPAVAPSSSYAVQGSQAPKPAIAPLSGCVAQGSQVPNPAVAPSSSYTAQGSQALKPAIAPLSSGYVAQGSQAPKPSVAPWSSYLAQGSQAPKPAIARSSSYIAQGSQAPKPAVTLSSSYVAQSFQAPKLSDTPSSSYVAKSSLASNRAVSPSSSYVAKGSQPPKLSDAPSNSHVAQGLPASKPAVAPASSNAAQVSQPSKLAVPRNRGTRTSPRTASSGHQVWSPKPKPEFDGHSSEARLQEEAPNEPAKTKKHEAIPSPTVGDVSEATVQKETSNKPAQTEEHVKVIPSPTSDGDSLQAKAQQETPNEHNLMIGSMPVPLDDFIRGGNKHSEALDAQTAERKKHSPAPSGTRRRRMVKFWREMLVPNGSRESEGESECSTSGGIEIVPRRNLLEKGDWESAIRISQAFLHQRWKRAVAREHVTLVVVLDSGDTDFEEKQEEKIVETVGSPASGAGKSEFSTRKPEKGTKKMYIPKQRHHT